MFQQQADVEEGHFPTAAGAQTDPEDPVMGSTNEQQFEVTQGSTGIASSPTAAVSQKERSGGDGEMMANASGAQLGGEAATPRIPPPPPPLSSQPLPFLFHGGGYPTEQQQTGAAADISFATESADAATAAVNTSGANIPAPPIPPPTFNPYSAPFRSPYHMNPYTDSSPMSHPAYSGAPLLLGSSYFPRGHFSNSPQLRPNHLPGYPYRSPMSYPPRHYHHPPHQWGDHPPSPGAAMFGSPGHHGPPPGQFAPPFLPPHRVSPYHLPPLAHPPFGGHIPPPPSFPPSFNIGQADGSGLGGNVRPSTLLPSQAQLRSGGPLSKVVMNDDLGLHSPSGTTAASLQVQPPSSPPSIPSINLQQPSMSNVNNCNAASVAMPNLGGTTTTNFSTTGMTATLPTPTTAGDTTLQVPAFSPTVGAISTPVLGASNSATSSMLELGPGPGPGPDTASSFPTLVKPIDFNKEMGAASLMAWKGQAFGGVPTGPVTTTAEMIVKGVEQQGGGAEGDRRLPVPVPVEKEESVSSLPVSIPEELRFVSCNIACMQPGHSKFSMLKKLGVAWGFTLRCTVCANDFHMIFMMLDFFFTPVIFSWIH